MTTLPCQHGLFLCVDLKANKDVANLLTRERCGLKEVSLMMIYYIPSRWLKKQQ